MEARSAAEASMLRLIEDGGTAAKEPPPLPKKSTHKIKNRRKITIPSPPSH
jgi:hypothetical protein